MEGRTPGTAEAGDPVARAEAMFVEGYSCSQAVLIAFAARLGLDPGVAARTASSFGGGMGRGGWTCGALTGAFIAIGLHAGSENPGPSQRKDDGYARVRSLADRFRAEHGATDCRELIGFVLADPVQHEAASAAGVFRSKCPGFVRTAARFVAETLEEPAAS